MSKLANLPPRGPAANLTTSPVADTFSRAGIPAYTYDTKAQLFLLAVQNMVGEDAFYESARKRDDRFSLLVRSVATTEPDWLLSFVTWLRGDGNMRTASLVAAVEGGEILAGTGYPRRLLAAAMQRADEPAEIVGYWLSTRGRKFPSWLKRGLADGAARLYNEYSVLKYDTQGSPIRFADVIELGDQRHIVPDEYRSTLWRYLLDRRHGNAAPWAELPESLTMIRDREFMNDIPQGARAAMLLPEQVKTAGMTWESVASWLGGPWTASAWEAVIPSMGYMALLRNLCNFDTAGISATAAASVAARIADPNQVAKSRQLPMRFLSAYNAVENDRYKVAIGDALQHSLVNVPVLDGDTAVLVDTSGSMRDGFSKDGTLHRWDAAAVFAIAFALANGIDEIQSFSNSVLWMPIPKGASLLLLVQRFQKDYVMNSGTDIPRALADARTHRPSAKRALVLTDEVATTYGVPQGITAFQRSYTFNLAGYREGMAPTTNGHYTVGGLSDAAFRMIAVLERGGDQPWPWA